MAPDQLTTVDVFAQTSFVIQAMLEARAAERDVSLIQTRLLGILRDREPTITDLAKVLELDKSSASGLVDRAERRGLVQRRRSDHDRRSVTVELTDEGRRLIKMVADEFQADVQALLAPLSADQREQVSSALEQILVSHAASHGVEL